MAQVSENKVVNDMALMDEWLNMMAEEVLDAKRVTNMATRKARGNKKARRKSPYQIEPNQDSGEGGER